MPVRPDAMIELVGDGHAALLAHLDDVPDAAREPMRASLLPGWTLGHILTHLARNADGLRRVLEGAERGVTAEQYVGGAAGREAGIEEGASRSWVELVGDVRATCAALDSQLAAQTTWDGGGTNSKGQPIPTEQVPFLRAREVFVHHADLGLTGYGPEQWPPRYVREELRRLTMAWDARKPMGATGLPTAVRALPELGRVLWLMGRIDVDGLPPARVF
jgi:maleylpyruvate isomerase